MQPSHAISESVSLNDLQTCNSPEYRLLTASVFTTAGCECMYKCTHVCGCALRMCVHQWAVCVCRCAQPEVSQVKDREYQLMPAASFCTKTHFMLHITVTQSVLDEGTNVTVTGRRILFHFCSGNNFRDLFSLQVPVWIGGRGNRFCSTHNN